MSDSSMTGESSPVMPDATAESRVPTFGHRTFNDGLLKPIVPDRRKRHSIPKASPHSPGEVTFDMNMKPKPRRHRRRFSEGEKVIINAVRKARACSKCHEKHRKVHPTVYIVLVISRLLTEGVSTYYFPESPGCRLQDFTS